MESSLIHISRFTSLTGMLESKVALGNVIPQRSGLHGECVHEGQVITCCLFTLVVLVYK